MTYKKIFALFVFVIVTSVSLGVEAKNGFYATHFPWDEPQLDFMLEAVPPPAKIQLVYYGGQVISNVKAYAVFWGPNVNSAVTSKIGDFLKVVSNSSYLDWLDEYNTFVKAVDGRQGTDQHLGRGKFLGQFTIIPNDKRTIIDDVDIQAELQKQIDAGVLPKPDDNTLFMTYFPAGMTITAAGMKSCRNFCAYHGFKGAPDTAHFFYGVMPDIGGLCSLGCSAAPTPFDSMTAITSHEFTEAITDPFPTPGSQPAFPQAWNTTDGSEIGDLCASFNNTLTIPGGQYIVQSEFDNSTAACTTSDWKSP